jgi:hypothetical protein
MPKGRCRLCYAESELQLSHILPAFAIRWLRDSSGTGHVRRSDSPKEGLIYSKFLEGTS